MFPKSAVIHFFLLSYRAQTSYGGGDGLSCDDHQRICRERHCSRYYSGTQAEYIFEDSYLVDCSGACHTECLDSLKGGTTNAFPNWSSARPSWWSDHYCSNYDYRTPFTHNAASREDAADDCFRSCLDPCVIANRPDCYANADAESHPRARSWGRYQCSAGTNSFFRQRCQSERNACIDECGLDSCHEICVAIARGTDRFCFDRVPAGQRCYDPWKAAHDMFEVEQRNCYDGAAYDCLNEENCYRASDRPPLPLGFREICIAGCNIRAGLNQECAAACATSGPSCYAECSENWLHECRHGMRCAFEGEIKLLERTDIERKKKSCGDTSYELNFVIGSHLFFLATQSNEGDDNKECPSFIFHMNFDNGNLGQEEMLEVENLDVLDIFSEKNENVISLGSHLLSDIIVAHADSALSSSGEKNKYDIFNNNCGDYIANFAKEIGYISTPSESKAIASVLLKENPKLPNQIRKKLKTLNEWLFRSVAGWSDEDFVFQLVEKKVKKTYAKD